MDLLFTDDTVDKQITIVTDDKKINITNTELHEDKFELSESLCSEKELKFGTCEASVVKFTISNIFQSLKGKWITVKITPKGADAPYQIGRYKVYSDKPAADRKSRDVEAYDALYDVLNADMAAWYNSLTFPMTLKAFRDAFFQHFGIEQEEISLVNDNMTVEKTIEITGSSADGSTIGEALSGKTVLSCICEINGCFGHIGRDGKFHYISLDQEMQGLYPRNDLYPADDLYPRDPHSQPIGRSFYISAKYEDYLVKSIDKLQINEKENDIGVIVGTGSNGYNIEGNFLVYGKGSDELRGIANNVFGKIKNLVYRPYSADCKGNPCLEVGNSIRFNTKYELIETYILKRTLKGIQALRDAISADGEEYRTKKVNSVHQDILQLKGKSNVLERTIEETKSTITDVEKGLQSQITQNAESITMEVKRATQAEGSLSSKITQTAESITSEVTRAKGAEESLSSSITQTAESIKTKVSKGSVSSEISQESDKVTLTANRLIVNSTGFNLDGNGNASLSGTITSSVMNASTITGTTITGSTFHAIGDTVADETRFDVRTSADPNYATFISAGGCRAEGPTWYGYIGHNEVGVKARNDSYKAILNSLGLDTSGGIIAGGSMQVYGAKNRIIETENYAERLQYCYETPTPMFGDVGEGAIDKTGKCYVWLDDVFAETIDTDVQYQIFLQAYGEGNVYVNERSPSYFVVCGTPGLAFGWEIKAVQKGYDTVRLESFEKPVHEETATDVTYQLLDDLEADNEDSAETAYQYLETLLYDTEKESEEVAA
jgi:prophage protein|uniref:Uncharacterized protein n=1 Tax=Myoviridae sp. ctvns3 TaxID=2825204 RepID=A0A8S5PCA8_9CAUD|nr:MAG TPA: hypothetical protein [Myoviridae sp. ctvns3]